MCVVVYLVLGGQVRLTAGYSSAVHPSLTCGHCRPKTLTTTVWFCCSARLGLAVVDSECACFVLTFLCGSERSHTAARLGLGFVVVCLLCVWKLVCGGHLFRVSAGFNQFNLKLFNTFLIRLRTQPTGKWQSSTLCFISIYIYLYCYLLICSNSVGLSQQCCSSDKKISCCRRMKLSCQCSGQHRSCCGRQIDIYFTLNTSKFDIYWFDLYYVSSPNSSTKRSPKLFLRP